MSREELILVKRLRKLVILTSIYSVFLGLFIIYLAITPLYVVEGVVEGYIALTRYELTFYGTPVRCDALLSVSYLSISLLILSVYLVFAGVLTLYLFFRRKDLIVGVRWLFGGALSALASSGLVIALINRVVSTIVTQLKLDLNHVTSAGILYLGTSSISTTYPAGYLSSPLVVLIVTLVYVVLAAITYLQMMIIEEYRLARYPPYREIRYKIVGS